MPLIPVTSLSFLPKYFHQGLLGADAACYVAEPVAGRLAHAQIYLRSLSSPGLRYDLMIWDAYRAPSTQRRIFDDYTDLLARTKGLAPASAAEAATRFVSRPDGVYPHGTGGAVDLTLLVNDEEAFMGTGFDAFDDSSASDWYERNPPRTAEDRTAAANRYLMKAAMLQAGFVPYPDEWWHYEWGTARWAVATGRPVVLDCTVSDWPVHAPAPEARCSLTP